MNKQYLIALAVVILIAGGVYVYTSTSDTPEVKDSASTDNTMTDEPTTASSLRVLLASGKNVTCEFSRPADEDGNAQEGTVYVSGDHVRGDFTITTKKEGAQSASMIQDGEWMYAWGGGFADEGEGYKVRVSETTGTSNEVMEFKKDTFDVDSETEYTCTSWKKDESKFVPPSDVKFKEFSFGAAMGEAVANINAETGMKIDCSVCDQAPGEDAQAQCRTALKC